MLLNERIKPNTCRREGVDLESQLVDFKEYCCPRQRKKTLPMENSMKPYVVHLQEGALAEVAMILDRLPGGRLFFVVDESAYKASGAAAILEPIFGQRSVTRFSGFELNPKLCDIERGVTQFREADADLVIALGGGTAIDLGKLIGAMACQKGPIREFLLGEAPIERDGPPLIAIPTTAGTGSEATHFAVAYVDGKKYSVAHPSLLPDYAIIDPALTCSLPASITASTGLDALCQAIESIWAVGTTDESLAYATEALSLALKHLECATNHPHPEARRGMCEASHLAGKAINLSKTTASHALSYAITSQHGLPHGIAVALTISPMLAYNAKVTASDCADPRGPEHVLKRIATILNLLGAESVATACGQIERLISAVGCPNSLRQAKMTTDAEIQRIVSEVDAHRLTNNPRKATAASLFSLLSDHSSATELPA